MSFLIEATVKPSSLQAFAHRPALALSKCGCENRIENTFSIRSVSAYRVLLIAAVLVVTIVQHRTRMLDKTACMCSKTSRVDNTKSVHNRPKPAVFVRTAQGFSSNQNEVSINSKSDLWRTALLKCRIFHILYMSVAVCISTWKGRGGTLKCDSVTLIIFFILDTEEEKPMCFPNVYFRQYFPPSFQVKTIIYSQYLSAILAHYFMICVLSIKSYNELFRLTKVLT